VMNDAAVFRSIV